ncbi:MAG: hypothetical protein E7616_08290 [Ruminococcaceae bacterium]|nr:hypothetical protein [Oscillospiraceae bacterium]
MSAYTPFIEAIQNTNEYTTKSQLLSVVLNQLQAKRKKLKNEDVSVLSAFVFSEIEALLHRIPKAVSYREKDVFFAYEDKLLGVIMSVYPSPQALPDEKLAKIQLLVNLVQKERYLEEAVDALFAKDTIEEQDAKELIQTVSAIQDTYHKGQLLNGLLHYQKEPGSFQMLSEQAIRVFSEYLASEMAEYLRQIDSLSEEAENNLELACDICKYFISDDIVNALYGILKHSKQETVYYAMGSLLHTGHEIPEKTVASLAGDLVVADMTYHLLRRYGKENLFPKELATPEYLAKSDLVHWLTYPTELGKAPDEIEYLGNTKVKGEQFYIFRYRSDSDTLDEETKNKWLIGWSSNEGGTFSNFDLYAQYEKKTPEKTVKYIKRKLL